MKTKLTVVVVTVLFGLAMAAQTATQSVPAAPATGDKASSCACRTGGKCPMGKDGKCDMAAHKDPAMAYGKSCCGEGCCKDDKCYMATHKAGKGGCCGDKCPMKGVKSASVLCCKALPAARGSGLLRRNGKVPPATALVEGDCCKPAAEASSCCKTGAACCNNENLPCCDANRQAG